MSLVDFKRVIRDAVAFFSKRGYTSQHDLDIWAKRIEDAARSSLIPPAAAAELISRHLRTIFARATRRMPQQLTKLQKQAQDRITKAQRALPIEATVAQRMTPELFFRRVETYPQLEMRMRNELDRRIAASADLIVLRREEAIDATLRRFRGWASSVPPGGTPAPPQPEKNLLAKEFKQVRYETNRLNIDQGMKLNAAIEATYAQGTGAIAAIWHSNWRQENYRFREEHKKRDLKVYTLRDNWAEQQGLMKVGKAGYTDQITQPAEEVYCQCYYQYLYSLIELPQEMLTAKGKKAITMVEDLNVS